MGGKGEFSTTFLHAPPPCGRSKTQEGQPSKRSEHRLEPASADRGTPRVSGSEALGLSALSESNADMMDPSELDFAYLVSGTVVIAT